MIAALAADVRPHGARRWDHAEIMAALKKLAHLSLPDVIQAVIRAADDRDTNSPFAVTNTTSPHWRERKTDRPEPSVRSLGPWCATCGVARDRHNGDHEFETPAEKRDTEAMTRIAESLKAEIRPLGDRPTNPAAAVAESEGA